MSGSRTAMPPRQPSSQNRELVYCHQCQNEWYRDQHGLQCPACQSEFIEILENDRSDPREEVFDGYEDYDSDDEHYHPEFDHPHHHHEHHHGPQGSGFTLRMGGTGPSISFRTLGQEFNSPSPDPFGGGSGHVVGGLNPGARSTTFGGATFPNSAHDSAPPPPGRSHGSTPMPDQSRRPPAPTSNFGNGGGPIAEMFTSIIQNIIGGNRGEEHPRSPPPHPSTFEEAGFPGAGHHGAGQNNPGQGSSQGERSRGSFQDSPFFMQMPRGSGGMSYYSSTRSWTGPNGEVRTIRTSSPMPHPRMQGEQATMDLADILVNIIGSQAHPNEQEGMSPFLRAFGLGHGMSGDYAWSQQDMDRILSQLMEQHQGNAPPPASQESIRNLQKVKVTQAEVDDGTECVVCQDDLKFEEEVVKLPCRHIYHEECVVKWLETHDACPICRTPITPESERQPRSNPGGPPGGGPQQPQFGGSGGSSGPGGAPGGTGQNMHTASGSGGTGGARWTWSASFGRS
ncbi:hypothetical protein Dda_7938 [Drechslerella dactyloides]|uniref:RING-type E3 ubiquitin transferase n=1 Tax=Drechslerella dactyloides TaxID=74499 RepID=A0AAD6IR90_DREDA|nr:hypothetical protein Dda_7938 [Drechslerella dactyloides]